jgi:hypothetical protein
MAEEPEPRAAFTEDWLKRAREAFDALPRGARVECAKAIGCSPAAITRVLAGDQATSRLIPAISVWLRIPPPHMPVKSELQAKLNRVAGELEPEAVEHLIWVAERLRVKDSTD